MKTQEIVNEVLYAIVNQGEEGATKLNGLIAFAALLKECSGNRDLALAIMNEAIVQEVFAGKDDAYKFDKPANIVKAYQLEIIDWVNGK